MTMFPGAAAATLMRQHRTDLIVPADYQDFLKLTAHCLFFCSLLAWRNPNIVSGLRIRRLFCECLQKQSVLLLATERNICCVF